MLFKRQSRRDTGGLYTGEFRHAIGELLIEAYDSANRCGSRGRQRDPECLDVDGSKPGLMALRCWNVRTSSADPRAQRAQSPSVPRPTRRARGDSCGRQFRRVRLRATIWKVRTADPHHRNRRAPHGHHDGHQRGERHALRVDAELCEPRNVRRPGAYQRANRDPREREPQRCADA